MALTFGQITEFQPETESIEVYEQRVKVFLTANDIAVEKQVAVFLSIIGSTNFALLTSLLAPAQPTEKTVDELLCALKTYYSKKRVTIAERYRFYNRVQSSEESVTQFATALRQLAMNCKFEGFLDQALRDKFVCGLRDSATQKKLLSGEDKADKLTFQEALEIAVTMETVATGVRELGAGETVLHTGRPSMTRPKAKVDEDSSCFRCGKQGHKATECRFKRFVCRSCGRRGHLQAVCRSRNTTSDRERKKAPVHKLDDNIGEDEQSSDDNEADLFQLRINSVKATPPIIAVLKVNGKPIRMEVDTGAAVSVVSEATYHRYWKSLPLIKTDLELQTYSAEKLPVIGKLEVDVKYGHQQVLGELYVVSGRGPSLLGRNILQHIRLDWPKIAKVHTIHSHQELTKILDKYPAVLCDQLGTFTKHKASLQLKDGATPRYFRPRPLPFALKETVERELDRLVAAGILEPVRTSQWATPIVVVPKKEGHIRLCGDYKVTINPVLLVDIHPIPKPQELFASLAGGVRFTKLDLSQAYQQMLLDEKSKELVTINTHKGLFRYTRLPFGVASAPAIFQRTMDCILQGETDMEHLQNLEEVLRRLKEHGITVKKSKCQFLQFRGTEKHGNADGLSRLPLPQKQEREKPDVATQFNVVQMSTLPLTHRQLRTASRCDSVVSKVMQYTKQGWPNTVPEAFKSYWRRRNEMTVEADCLLWGTRVVIPGTCRDRVLKSLHESHPGIVRMKSQARSYVWWPGLDKDIEKIAKSCDPCSQVKDDPAPVTLHPWVWPSKPWKRLHIDFAGPIFNKSYLVIVDAYSKWPEVWEMASTSTTKTIHILQHLFSRYGFPEQMVSDNGPQFRSEEFAQFMKECGIKHYRSAVYHPATNGAVERFVKTLKQALKTGYLTGSPLKEVLLQFLFKYRSTPHTVTECTPGELFLGRPLRNVLDLLRPNQREKVERKQNTQKYYHDRSKRNLKIKKGSRVLARVYRRGLMKWEKGQVQKLMGSRLVQVRLNSGAEITRHLDQLRFDESSHTGTEIDDDDGIEITGIQDNEEAVTVAPEVTPEHIPIMVEDPTTEPVLGPPTLIDSNEQEMEDGEHQGDSSRRYPLRERRPTTRPWFVSQF